MTITIRPYNANKDVDRVLEIWLKASIQSHSFINESFWYNQLDSMRNIYLPLAETLILEEEKDDEIKGFLSLDENRLAALFIHPSCQGHGYGKELLDEAKKRRNLLELTVYCANTRACTFYQACGFSFVTQQKDTHTGHLEWLMRWKRDQELESE